MRDWGWGAALATAQTKIYETGRNYTLSVVPLFILMGNFVTRAGMSQELFRAAHAFLRHLPLPPPPRPLPPPPRRPRHGPRLGLGRLRRHLRLVDRHRGHHGQGRLSVHE